MATYSRRISLRESFLQILTRRSLFLRRPNRLRGTYLFRALVRLVLEYIDWLTQEPVAEEIGDDVAVNIRMAQEKKIEKALTRQDRSILLIKPEERNSEDRKYIYELYKKFRVFRKYPERVREMLVGICLYQYLEPNRVIVRQGHPAENVYFIISGEVGISKVVTDRWTGESETIDMGVLKPGNIFGEVALLHKIPRSATVVTKTVVELILITRQDFNDILRSHLQKEWDILQDAVVHFNYFKSWDEETIRECCILSKLHNYEPDEVLLGDGKGMVNYVHFLVDGECRLIEHMHVQERRTIHGVHYQLYDPSKADATKGFGMSFKAQDRAEELSKVQFQLDATKSGMVATSKDQMSAAFSGLLATTKSTDRKIDADRESIITTTLLDAMTEWHKITDVAQMLMREPSSISQQCYPSDVRTIFMQICTFYRGACFGLGENMRDRRIITTTAVKCFLVPRHWLGTHNRANIWERVKLFMDSKFPSKEQLFRIFVRDRRWIEYKKSLLSDVGKRGRCAHSNVTIHDVPYAIRIAHDIGVEK